MAQGSQWENICAWRCFVGCFFFAIWPRIFSSFLSLFSCLFFCLFLCISYAGPFEPRLIGVDGTALQRYNGKPNIFGSKIWPFFSYFLRALISKTGVQDSHLAKSRSPTGKSGSPIPKSGSPTNSRIPLSVVVYLTLILPFATIVALGGWGSASSKACHTYNIPHATIQSKCSHTGVNLLSYKHATFH